jgi:hypothetical protein
MGKDQNAKGGLVCAHPPLALITGMGEDQNASGGLVYALHSPLSSTPAPLWEKTRTPKAGWSAPIRL